MIVTAKQQEYPPLRLEFATESTVPLVAMRQNVQDNRWRPKAYRRHAAARLAVVGGGSSVREHLDELKAWDGEIWAINYTGKWLSEQGIRSTLVTVDPSDVPMPRYPLQAGALIATCCNPSRFGEHQPYAEAFDLSEDADGGVIGGTTTATRTPVLALRLGFSDISFFGCDGSYAEQSHADRNYRPEHELVVRANGQDYITTPDYYLQSQDLAGIIAALPDVFRCRSGGLLAAMLADPDGWEVIAVSEALKAAIDAANPGESAFGERL